LLLFWKTKEDSFLVSVRKEGRFFQRHSALSKRQARSSFLKKRSKKLLFFWGACWGQRRDSEQKFFGSFFQKRTF
jgi:hypothetical protein